MESSGRYLKDLLSQEQEPFALQSFIDERRYQLRRPKRRPPPPSATSSPLFLDVKKKSPLFDLAHAKNAHAKNTPSAAACLLLEAALRIHGGRQKQQKKRNKVKQLGLRFFSSMLKKLSQKKPRCDVNIISCTNDYSQQVILAKDVLELEEDGKCEGPLEDVVMVRNIEGETMGATLSSTTGTSASTEESNSLQAEDPTPVTGSPKRESPAAVEPQISMKKKVLVGEDEGGGGGGGDELLQDKQQLSPVSVLSFHHDEEEEEEDEQEDDQSQQQSHHQYQGGGGDHEQESFQHSLAIVQRSKDQLMRQIRRFERLAGLDPIQLDKLLHEEEDQHDDNTGHENVGAEWKNLREGDIYEFATVLQSPHDSLCTSKLPMDLKKLLSDLFKTERKGTPELDRLVERVSRRFEAWKEVSCRNVEVLVDLDFRQEGEKWKNFAEQVQDFAVQIELSIFEILVCELFE